MLSIVLLLPLLAVGVVCDAPVTINDNDAYQRQRVCAFSCFIGFDDIGYPIAQEISCPTFPVQNDCFCRTDLQRQAHLYVSSCISGGCDRNKNDISVATKLYDDYCTSNGYTQTSQVTETSESGALTITITAPPVTTVTATVTVTAGASSEPPTRWMSFAPLVVIVMARVLSRGN